MRALLAFARLRNHCSRRRGVELATECLLVVACIENVLKLHTSLYSFAKLHLLSYKMFMILVSLLRNSIFLFYFLLFYYPSFIRVPTPA